MSTRASPRNAATAKRNWRHMVRFLALSAALGFAVPVVAAGEIIYVSAFNVYQGNSWVHRFDSESPTVILDSFEVDLPLFSVEFDQSTGELYAFEHYDCLIATCPPPSFDVARIDPFSGRSTIL